MKVLSVYPYTHISSSALVIDGEVVAAAAEERFNREKMSTKFPVLSARWCLEYKGLDWDDLDVIAVPWNPMHNINWATKRWVSDMTWRGEMLSHVPTQIMRAIDGPVSPHVQVQFGKVRLMYLNHHECHAANGFYLSPFERADFLTIDGHGEQDTCLMGVGDGARIEPRASVRYPHSLGLFYGTFTDFLGFTPDVDEWKAMALSSFSEKPNDYDKLLRDLIRLTGTGFELDLSYFDYYTFDRRPHFFNQKLVDLIGPPRKREDAITERHHEIAGAMQRVFSEAARHMLTIARQTGGGSGNIVLSGGAAMNCVFNGLMDTWDIYRDSSISSAPDDLGVSVGAALLAYYRMVGPGAMRRVMELKHNYWGPSFSNQAVKDTLNRFKIEAVKPSDLTGVVAKALGEGQLVGWFQGAMEFGHRALGNRSILADPRDASTKDCVNSAVKYRESFRPFAPAVLAERAEELFDLRPGRKVRFMERVAHVKPEWRSRLGAVTHVDNTARLQTVEREVNPLFYDLIEAFEKLTGVPVLLNTSFNLNGEPIVCTPEHAIRTFFSCGLDVLVLGPYVIRKL